MLYQTESTHFSLFMMYIGPCHKSSRRLDVEEQESNKPATVTLESPIDKKNVVNYIYPMVIAIPLPLYALLLAALRYLDLRCMASCNKYNIIRAEQERSEN